MNDCLFPQPRFIPPSRLMMTGCRRYLEDSISGFYIADSEPGPIDAPDYVPSGSHDSIVIGNRCPSFAAVDRLS